MYPPTDLKDFLRCPQYRAYRKAGWEPMEAEWTPNLLLGKAIGEGLTVAWRSWGQDQVEPTALAATLALLETEYIDNERWGFSALEKLAGKGLTAGLEKSLSLIGSSKILAVDSPLGTGARPDLVLQDAHGLAVWDGKVTMSLDVRREHSRLAEYEHDDQLWHYGWEAGEFYGVPVHTLGVLLISLQPRPRAILHSWPCDPVKIAWWRQDAEYHWQEMDAERLSQRPVTRRFSGCLTKFGPCSYHMICHTFLGDTVKAGAFYQRRIQGGV